MPLDVTHFRTQDRSSFSSPSTADDPVGLTQKCLEVGLLPLASDGVALGETDPIPRPVRIVLDHLDCRAVDLPLIAFVIARKLEQ